MEEPRNLIFLVPYAIQFITGLAAKHAQAGAKVVAVIGIEYDDESKVEIKSAAAILGVRVTFLDLKRGDVQPSLYVKKELVNIIREMKPDITVMAPDPKNTLVSIDPDALDVYRLFHEATIHTGRPIFPDLSRPAENAHNILARYYPNDLEADVIVNIADVFDKIIEASLTLKYQVNFIGQMMPTFMPEKILRILIDNYDMIKEDHWELGKAATELFLKSTAVFHGSRGRTGLGEAYRREAVWGLRTCDYLSI